MNLSSSIRTRLQYQHHTIEELIKGYDEEQLKLRTNPGKWSAFENIVHLVSYQDIFQQRIDKILTGTNPSFERYIAENDPEFERYLQQPLRQLLQTLHIVRKQFNDQLNNLSMNELLSIGHHPKYGALSLVQWTEFFLLHEAHHLFTMFKLLNDRESV